MQKSIVGPLMESVVARSQRLTRGSLFFLGVGVGLLGCEEDKSAPVSRARSEAIVAAPGAQRKASLPPPEAAGETTAEPRGPLCASKPNTPFPKTSVGGMGTQENPFVGGAPGRKGPAWINLWAAWCEPCKKEIPILRQFQSEVAKDENPIELEFVSLDDDSRQLERFLEAQPGEGIKRTFWLREGKEREEWLADAGLPEDPRLPVHLLVSSEGSIFCRIEGSIEPSDLDAVKAAFKGK